MAAIVLSAALIFGGIDGSLWDEPVQAVAPAVHVETRCMAADPAVCDPPTTVPRETWAYCEEWHDLAAAVGWPESQGPTLAYVMHRESRCNPGAYNPTSCGRGNHAIGLLQLCGWGGAELYDPGRNLAKGLELWQRSGWCPWVLRGDPVTGHAC